MSDLKVFSDNALHSIRIKHTNDTLISL